jgi:hypothetical protein
MPVVEGAEVVAGHFSSHFSLAAVWVVGDMVVDSGAVVLGVAGSAVLAAVAALAVVAAEGVSDHGSRRPG